MTMWINANYDFGHKGLVLRIPYSYTVEIRNRVQDAGRFSDPDQLVTWLEELITYERPTYKGLVVHAMSFDLPTNCWLVRATHPSFPRCDWNTEVDIRDLA